MKTNYQIVNPHLLTPNALKMAKGEQVENPTPEDLQSYNDWLERCPIVDKIVSGIADQFKSWQG